MLSNKQKTLAEAISATVISACENQEDQGREMLSKVLSNLENEMEDWELNHPNNSLEDDEDEDTVDLDEDDPPRQSLDDDEEEGIEDDEDLD